MFTYADGRPVRPEYLTHRFRELVKGARRRRAADVASGAHVKPVRGPVRRRLEDWTGIAGARRSRSGPPGEGTRAGAHARRSRQAARMRSHGQPEPGGRPVTRHAEQGAQEGNKLRKRCADGL